MATAPSSFSLRRIRQDLNALVKDKTHTIIVRPHEDNIAIWDLLIPGPEGTIFQDGLFPARLNFPNDYPMSPPKMRFMCDFHHPNVYPSGEVCISILHAPGADPSGYEHASERWSPAQSARIIILSVMSIMADPNCDSPANVDASKMLRERPEDYARQIRRLIDSLYEIPDSLKYDTIHPTAPAGSTR